MSHRTRAIILLHGITNLAVGLVMYLLPGQSDLWPRPGSAEGPLMSICGGALVAFGLGSLLGSRSRLWLEVRPVARMQIPFGVIGGLTSLYAVAVMGAPPLYLPLAGLFAASAVVWAIVYAYSATPRSGPGIDLKKLL